MSDWNVATLYAHLLSSSCLAAVFSYFVYTYKSDDQYSLLVLMLYGVAIHIISRIHNDGHRERYLRYLIGGEKIRANGLWRSAAFSFLGGALGLGVGIAIYSMGFNAVLDRRYVFVAFIALLWIADSSSIIRAYIKK